MEEKNCLAGEEVLSGEIIETYRPADHREVVEQYSRPLPEYFQPRQSTPVPPGKKKKTGLWIFLILLAVAFAVAGAAWYWNGIPEPEKETEPSVEEEITIPRYPFGEGAELQVTQERGGRKTPQEIYERVNPAVVTVITQLDHKSASVGAGVIFTEDGYVLTNYHVVEGGLDCVIVLDNDYSLPADYVAGDAEHDLAILKADATGLPTAVFGDSDSLVVGDTVYAIGNPLGVELRGTFTNGIVSAIDRDVRVDHRVMNLIQTNAALNSGNSGGPLIDEYGRVVGINVIKMSSRYDSVEGLGFAIPSASVDRLVNDLLTYGEVQPEPRLGMSVYQVGTELSAGLWGAEVAEVVPNSAAEKAGIQVGDFIIRAGDVEIHGSQDVLRARRQYHLGDKMPVVVWRNGILVNLTLDLQDPVN